MAREAKNPRRLGDFGSGITGTKRREKKRIVHVAIANDNRLHQNSPLQCFVGGNNVGHEARTCVHIYVQASSLTSDGQVPSCADLQAGIASEMSR